jgi:DNA-binding SARP family transcriptional activator/Tfp pilus assembly protein PilF
MLVVNLLGPPEALLEGKPIQVDTRKAIALLAYLLIEKTATRDTLAAMLWAESSQERARATLRRTLSALRAATGNELIVADRSVVSLAGGVSSDVHTILVELEATGGHGHESDEVCSRCIPHLRRAIDLYRGEFLQGFSVRSSPEFEDWTRSVAESMRIRVGEMFNRLGTAFAANGEYPAAISTITRWIGLDPLHEPAHRLLMLLCAWSGDRPGAITAYRNCVAIFDQELGVAPLEETTELYEAILDEDLPPAPGLPRRIKAERTPLRSAPSDLIDRVAELQVLHAALGEGVEGGRLLAVTGAPWMGKTRLLEELAVEASHRGIRVLVGRAFRMEQTLPYGVVTQVLRSTMPLLAEDDAQVPAWALTEIGRLLPEIGTGPAELVPDRFGELRLLESIYTVMASLAATSPLVVVLDDLQWMDPGSSAVFAYLARRLPGVPMLLVAAARSGEDLLPAAAEMMANADQTITIGPLTAPQLTPLLDDDLDAAARLLEVTGGVPLLVAEALSADDGVTLPTPGMARYMESRLSEMGDLARQILTAAAVLNGMCDAGLLRETSGRSEEEVVEAVEELVEAGLLRELPESDVLGFTLDALERVTYESTSLVRRRLLHRRAARAMSERGHARTDAGLAAAIAAQHGAAGDPEAAGWYRLAGDLARSIYANESARDFYQTSLALGHSDMAGVRLALGELAMTAGDYSGARRELTLAAAHAGPDHLGLIEHRTGEVERLLGRFEIAEEHFQRAIESHPAPAAVYSDWALLAHRTGDPDKATDLATQARAAAEREGEPGQVSRVHNILAVVTAERDQALEHVEQALRLAGDDSILRMAALNNKAVLVSDSGDHDEAIENVREAVAIAERTGHRHREAALWNHMADLHHRAGRERESQDALTRAVSLFADVDAGDLEPELWLLSRW